MSKKRRYSDLESLTESKNVDWSSCIICQVHSYEKLECPSDFKHKGYDPFKTYQNIANNINRFQELNAIPIDSLILSKEKCTPDLFLTMKAKFHKLCRNKFSDMKSQRMEQRINTIEIEPQPEDEQNVDCKITEEETISQATQSSTRPSASKDAAENDDLLCFFCGKGKPQNLRRASTFKLDKKVRECAMTLQDFDLLAKLSEGDMIAQDAMYHPLWLLAFYKKAKSANGNSAPIVDEEKELHGMVLAELLVFMQLERDRLGGNCVFKMADLAALYKKRFEDLGGVLPERVHSTRLKLRLLAHIDGLTESKRGKTTYLAFDDDLCDVFKTIYEKDFDEDAFVLSRAADILRKSLLERESKEFDSEFHLDSQSSFVPQVLSSFVDMILQGTNINKNKKYLEQANLTISQLIDQSIVKRTRDNTTANYFCKGRELPLGVYLGMMVHAKTKNKQES